MKKITFKTLSILLAAVLLVAALPVTAFAEDVSPCAIRPCEHNFEVTYYAVRLPATNEYHYTTIHMIIVCTLCGYSYSDVGEPFPEWHEFDDSVDEEVDMSGTCIYCGDYVSW